MTTIFYGANPHDGGPETVATGTSTTGKALEITIDNTKIKTEDEVIQICERIFVFLQQKRLNLA